MIKRILSVLTVELFLLHTQYAQAIDIPRSIGSSQDAKSFIESKGESIVNIFALFGIFACVAGAIYGGIKIGTGDPDKGKTILVSSLIGASIILGVNSLIGVVIN
ncbi:MAG: hypothetical protein QM538_02550 [Methylacidiphilales bacterium]|nr:hypothetical protein [Candidatus Methylacidiphilales bacterium]